ncbi:hypothetical protein [Alteromonas sp. A079]|uniref:hypothetical protein n=1 Tax=Alteromonas sp. A079 TaxID=3410268 RepID=UPI003BA07B68
MKKTNQDQHPVDDPAVKSLLKRMDPNIANSFTIEQLVALRRVVGLRGGRLHSVDVRATVKLPFLPWSFYAVFVAGKNRRDLSQGEKNIAVGMFLLIITLSLLIVCLIGLLVVYLLKSWLGINIFESYSFGVWDWFKNLY